MTKWMIMLYKNLFSKIKKNLFWNLVLLWGMYNQRVYLGIWGNFFMNTQSNNIMVMDRTLKNEIFNLLYYYFTINVLIGNNETYQ